MTKNKNTLLLLVGDGFSAFGAWIDFLAILTLAAYQFQVSAYQMAVVSAAGLLPGVLAAPWIGRLCDTQNPQRLLLVSIALRVAATGGILFFQDYSLFVALVGLRSLFASVATPAINVLAVRTVAPAERARFYSVLNVLNNSAKVLAPPIGTVSSALTSEAVALGISIACSAAALLAFGAMRLAPARSAALAASAANPASGNANTADGNGTPPAAVLSSAPTSLTPLLWIAATSAFCIFMVNNLVPLVLQQAGFDKSLLGLLVSCSGAGNILAGLWLAKRAAKHAMRGTLKDMVAPAAFQAIGFGAIGLLLWAKPAHTAALLPALFFVIGTFSARYAIAMNIYITTHFAARIGHVSGTLQAWQSAMILVAPMVGAVVLDALGPAWLFAFATGSAALSFAVFFALRAGGVRGLRAERQY